MDAPGNFLNVKLIPEFDGSSHTVAEWLRKAESACQLCGITDVARAIGLRLTGAAFEVFDQMAPEERGNLEKRSEKPERYGKAAVLTTDRSVLLAEHPPRPVMQLQSSSSASSGADEPDRVALG
uniref:Uncharacterized protein n=1 Tax=Trichuris muris TaxID=70415 RepID=A0A5S6QBC6_TRIMR